MAPLPACSALLHPCSSPVLLLFSLPVRAPHQPLLPFPGPRPCSAKAYSPSGGLQPCTAPRPARSLCDRRPSCRRPALALPQAPPHMCRLVGRLKLRPVPALWRSRPLLLCRTLSGEAGPGAHRRYAASAPPGWRPAAPPRWIGQCAAETRCSSPQLRALPRPRNRGRRAGPLAAPPTPPPTLAATGERRATARRPAGGAWASPQAAAPAADEGRPPLRSLHPLQPPNHQTPCVNDQFWKLDAMLGLPRGSVA
jgi:hypothetical protein